MANLKDWLTDQWLSSHCSFNFNLSEQSSDRPCSGVQLRLEPQFPCLHRFHQFSDTWTGPALLYSSAFVSHTAWYYLSEWNLLCSHWYSTMCCLILTYNSTGQALCFVSDLLVVSHIFQTALYFTNGIIYSTKCKCRCCPTVTHCGDKSRSLWVTFHLNLWPQSLRFLLFLSEALTFNIWKPKTNCSSISCDSEEPVDRVSIPW